MAVTLPGTGITTSRLGLGCAELFREPSRAQRRRLLDRALDAGIRHFDVAPMYGLGRAEAELGAFARGRRDQLVIATKFGIAPSPAARAVGHLQGPARRLLAASPALRSRARSTAAGPASGAAGSLLYHAAGFSRAAARASLDRSLRELGTDHVDLLLLHDPDPSRVPCEEVCAQLEQERVAGRLRAWGIAGEPEPSLELARRLPVHAQVLQLRDDILAPGPGRPAPASARITFGVLGGAIQRLLRELTTDPGRRRAWRDRVRVDCADAGVLAGLLLRWAAGANPDGVVLFGTIRADHIAAAAASLGSREGDLDAFVALIDAELRAPSGGTGES